MSNRIYLKIKALSLAEEARVIKAQEQRLLRRIAKARARLALDPNHIATGAGLLNAVSAWNGIRSHRIFEVRREARCTNLAVGFLRGRAYRIMEAVCWKEPDWKRVAEIAEKYRPDNASQPLNDPRVLRQRFAEWKDAAGELKQPKRTPGEKRQRVSKGRPAVTHGA